MYIEASFPRRLGDYAVLSSPEYSFRGLTCVTFYYHMYGTTIGNLTVTLNGRLGILFSRSGNQGNAWLKAQVNTFGFGSHKVREVPWRSCLKIWHLASLAGIGHHL